MEMIVTKEGAPKMRAALLVYLQLAGGGFVLLYGLVFMLLGLPRSATVELSYGAFILATIVWAKVLPQHGKGIVWCHVFAVLGVVFAVSYLQGGLFAAAGFVSWGPISPVAALIFLGSGPALLMLSLLSAVTVYLSQYSPPAMEALPQGWLPWFGVGNVIGGFALVLMATGYLLRKLAEEYTRLEAYRESQVRAQKLSSLGTLAGGIAHDFNNILMAFSGNLHLARRELTPDHPAARRLDRAQRALTTATGLTDQLLTFAKGGMAERRVVRLEGIVEEAATFVLHGRNVDARFIFEPDLPAVKADPTQISQLVQNIVINGAQAMWRGGQLEVTVRRVAPEGDEVPLELDLGRRYVALDVKDWGDGIPEGVLPRIFDPYFTTRESGSGLGLATAYSIADKHHGAIYVNTEQGKGTTFTVYLPSTTQQPVEVEAPQSSPPPLRSRILIMDDEPAVLEVLREMLIELGHEVVTSTDGADAMELYVASQANGLAFEAVILDLTVKGGPGGVATSQALLEEDPDAVLIASSGYAHDPVMSNCRKYGFKEVLRKPYSISALKDVLARALPGTGPTHR